MQLIDHQIRLQLPAYWPRALQPEALNRMDHPTPFLVCDLETVRERYTNLTAALPGVSCYYAVKCNPEPELLAAFDQLGSSFEVASWAELQMLQKLGVDPERVLYSNTVKPAAHIAESFVGRALALRLRLRGRALQAGPARPGGGGVRAAPGRRLDQPVPAVPQVRGRGPGGPGPDAAGPQPRPAALRGDLPRRVPVHHHDRLAPGHRGRRTAAQPPVGRRHHPGDAEPGGRVPGPLRRGRAVGRPDRQHHRVGPARAAPLPARAAGRRARALPGGRERGAGRRGPRPGGHGPARTGPTWTSAPTTG